MLPRLFYSISAKTAACSALYSHRSPAVLGRGLGNRIFRPGNIKPVIPVAALIGQIKDQAKRSCPLPEAVESAARDARHPAHGGDLEFV